MKLFFSKSRTNNNLITARKYSKRNPLERHRHLTNRLLWSVYLVSCSLTRSQSVASLEYFLARASPFHFHNPLFIFLTTIQSGDYVVLRKKVYPNIHVGIISFHLQHGKIRIHVSLMGLSTLK